jgi:hypothetical protein
MAVRTRFKFLTVRLIKIKHCWVITRCKLKIQDNSEKSAACGKPGRCIASAAATVLRT